MAGEGRVYISRAEEYDLKFRRFLRFKDFTALEDWRGLRETLIPNLNLLDGIALTSNFDPLITDRYSRWMAEIESLSPEQQRTWLALMGVSAVEHIDGSRASGVRFDAIEGSQRWWWFACAVPVSSSDQAFQMLRLRLQGSPEEAWKAPFVEGKDPEAALERCGETAKSSPPGGEIKLVDQRPDRLTLEVSSTNPGWLYLADAWYPGWQVQIDGNAGRLQPANFLFKAVYLVSGKHQVTLYYRPFGFYFGVLFSILVLLFFMFLITRLGRKPNPGSSFDNEKHTMA
jgi:hypothetical protein